MPIFHQLAATFSSGRFQIKANRVVERELQAGKKKKLIKKIAEAAWRQGRKERTHKELAGLVPRRSSSQCWRQVLHPFGLSGTWTRPYLKLWRNVAVGGQQCSRGSVMDCRDGKKNTFTWNSASLLARRRQVKSRLAITRLHSEGKIPGSSTLHVYHSVWTPPMQMKCIISLLSGRLVKLLIALHHHRRWTCLMLGLSEKHFLNNSLMRYTRSHLLMQF